MTNINGRISEAFLKDYVHGEEKTWDDIKERLFSHPKIPADMALRLKSGFMKHFVFSTPILLNFNTKNEAKNIESRGFPIACYLTKPGDNMEEITFSQFENQHMLYHGGGVGTNFNAITEIGHDIKDGASKTEGIIPFLVMLDKTVAGTSQGARRGVESVTLRVDHPEIEEFIRLKDMHNVTEIGRKAPTLFPSVLLTDEFMAAKDNLEKYNLYSSRGDKVVVGQLDAFDMWTELLQSRKETGVPFLLFESNMNKNMSETYTAAALAGDLHIDQSQVCTEITLKVDSKQSAVCCLGSLNLSNIHEFEDELDQLLFDMSYFLMIVLNQMVEDIDTSTPIEQFAFHKVREFIVNDRSIAIGVMGISDLFQQEMLPFESLSAKYRNKDIFKKIRQSGDKVNMQLADVFGPAPFAKKHGIHHAFCNMFAPAPTGSISKIIGCSPCIEPRMSNRYVEKNDKGTFIIHNPVLYHWMEAELNEEEIAYVEDFMEQNDGSIAGVRDDIIPQEIKDVFKTVKEINMHAVVELAGDRQEYIDQSQSLNLFFDVNAKKTYIDSVHSTAYKRGVKTLYYNRPLNGGAVEFKECVWCT